MANCISLVEVVSAVVPFLFPRPCLRRMHSVLNFNECTLQIGTAGKCRLVISQNNHYLLRLEKPVSIAEKCQTQRVTRQADSMSSRSIDSESPSFIPLRRIDSADWEGSPCSSLSADSGSGLSDGVGGVGGPLQVLLLFAVPRRGRVDSYHHGR